MAKNLSVQVIGAPLKKDVEATTVQDVMNQLNISGTVSAIVNRSQVENSHELADGDFVVFTQNIKGAMSWDEETPEETESIAQTLWCSPTLVIVRLADNFYRVNGQKITLDQLNELADSLSEELEQPL